MKKSKAKSAFDMFHDRLNEIEDDYAANGDPFLPPGKAKITMSVDFATDFLTEEIITGNIDQYRRVGDAYLHVTSWNYVDYCFQVSNELKGSQFVVRII